MSDPLEMTAAQVEALSEKKTSEVLGAWVKAKKAGLPEALARSTSKPHARLAKKALYQLKSSGVAVAEVRAAQDPTPERAEAPEDLPGTMSPILGTGDRALVFARPLRGGGVELYQALISDELGIVKLDRIGSNRGVYRQRLKELKAQTELSLAFVPLARVIEELGRALTLNDRSRTNLTAELTDGLNRLGVVPLDPDWALPALEPTDAATASRGGALHDEKEITQWLPPEKQLEVLSARVAEVEASPLALSAPQKAEHLASKVEATVTGFFTAPMRQLYGRRLWQMAELYDSNDRKAAAQLTRATARHLFHTLEPSAFATRLFAKVLETATATSTADKVKSLLASVASPKLSPP